VEAYSKAGAQVGPAAPANLRAVPGDGTVTLHWDYANDNHIGGWMVWREDAPRWRIVSREYGATSHKVTGLTDVELYRFRVRAFLRSSAIVHSYIRGGAVGPDPGVIEARPNGPLPRLAIFSPRPRVTGWAVTSNPGADQTYAAGDSIEITFTFNKAITVTGTPQLELLLIGRQAKTVDCARRGNPDKLVCTYTVKSGDLDIHGIRVNRNTLALPDGASIADAQGVQSEYFDLEFESDGLSLSGHKVIAAADSSKPYVTLRLSSAGGRVREGGSITVTALLSRASTEDITIAVSRRTQAIVIPAGQTSGSTTVSVPAGLVEADTVIEPYVVYTPADAIDATRSPQRYTVVIIGSS
jgi:hypothetical protein